MTDQPTDPRDAFCDNPRHTSVLLMEDDYERCGDCGLRKADRTDGSCAGCNAPVDGVHARSCPVWFGRSQRDRIARHEFSSAGEPDENNPETWAELEQSRRNALAAQHAEHSIEYHDTLAEAAGRTTIVCLCGKRSHGVTEAVARASRRVHLETNGVPLPTEPAPIAQDREDADDAAAELGVTTPTGGQPGDAVDTVGEQVAPDVWDATRDPGVGQEMAMHTDLTPAQFHAWLQSDGELFMVLLPGNKSFVMKVPAAQHEFFVAMMQQIRFALGSEVQASRMSIVRGAQADADGLTFDPADGQSDQAPEWAQPKPAADATPRTATHCPGRKPVPNTIQGREVTNSGIVRSAGRGMCPDCGGVYKLTNRAELRAHGKTPGQRNGQP